MSSMIESPTADTGPAAGGRVVDGGVVVGDGVDGGPVAVVTEPGPVVVVAVDDPVPEDASVPTWVAGTAVLGVAWAGRLDRPSPRTPAAGRPRRDR